MNIKTLYTHTNLAQRPDLLNATINLIETSMNYQSPFSFKEDFAPLMSENNRHQNYIVVDNNDNKVITHIGVNLRILGNSNFQIPVALIGGIATNPDYRGQGHFSSLFKHVIDRYENKVALFILWSNLIDLYRKFHFVQAGEQLESGELFFDEKKFSFDCIKTKFSQIDNTTFDFIRSLYDCQTCKHYTSLMRSHHDWKSIRKMDSTDLYICQKNNRPIGYFCIGKGFDLQNIIHEAEFIETERRTCLQELSRFKMWLPLKNNADVTKGNLLFLALFKAGNLNLFGQMISAWSHNDIQINRLEATLISYSHEGESFIDTTEGFLQKVFGPAEYFQDYNYGPALFFSGLDSI